MFRQLQTLRLLKLSNIQKTPNQLALFIHDTLHVIEDDDALLTTSDAAEKAYEEIYKYE